MNAISSLVAAVEQQITKHRSEENELLNAIARLSDYVVAESARELYSPENHAYGFSGYLEQLSKVRALLGAGIEPCRALELADSFESVQGIIGREMNGG